MGGVQLKKEASVSCDFIMVWVIGVCQNDFRYIVVVICISGGNHSVKKEKHKSAEIHKQSILHEVVSNTPYHGWLSTTQRSW